MAKCEMGHDICGGCNGCHYCASGYPSKLLPPGGCETCWRTQELCDCITCELCAAKVVKNNGCQICNKCKTCCICPRCSVCQKVGKICEDCTKCERCCRCRLVKFQQRDVVWHKNKKGKNKINPSQRFIALEPEIYSVLDFRPINKVCDKWGMSVVHDGSIGNGDRGFEINTSPAQGQMFVDQITELGESFLHGGATVEDSCGCHVHIGVKDFNFWDISKLIDLYSKIENALYSLVKPNRKTNRFCIPCGKNYFDNMIQNTKSNPKNIKEVFSQTIYNENKKSLITKRIIKYDDARYASLNLHSFSLRQTIENRILHGTTHTEEMINWGILWASIIDFASQRPHFKNLPDEGLDILLEIAPTDSLKDWILLQNSRFIPAKPKRVYKKRASRTSDIEVVNSNGDVYSF